MKQVTELFDFNLNGVSIFTQSENTYTMIYQNMTFKQYIPDQMDVTIFVDGLKYPASLNDLVQNEWLFSEA